MDLSQTDSRTPPTDSPSSDRLESAHFRLSGDPGTPGFQEFSTIPPLGDATASLKARLPDGNVIDVFPPRDLKKARIDLTSDPNLPFKLFNTPLFPVTNRLRGGTAANEVRTEVEGFPVRMPKNHHGGNPGSERTHLHGLLHSRRPDDARVEERQNHLIREARFSNFFEGWWVGQTEVVIRQCLSADDFQYQITAKNTGNEALPIGFGSHPYFFAPSNDATAVQIRVPAKKVALIDNLQDVFPTGDLKDVVDEPTFDFNTARSIAGVHLDNFWTDLVPDEEGFPYAEMIDSRAGVRYRITATTRNIVGVQVYYPGSGAVVAIELVSHLPDPRAELWKKQDTGMRVLEPGESEIYGYRIEVYPTVISR